MNSIIKALDVLVEYPDLQEYIRDFDSPNGFMFTIETEKHRAEMEERLNNLLDPDEIHSGSSWGFMLRDLQQYLNGRLTREQLLEKAAEEEALTQKRIAQIMKLRNERAQQAEQAQAEQAQAEQAQAEQAQAEQAQAEQGVIV